MMDIRRTGVRSSMPLDKLAGTNDWYYAVDWACDLYEAEELVARGEAFEGSTLHLLHYPDGRVWTPFEKRRHVYIETPVWDGEAIAVLTVDLDRREMAVFRLDAQGSPHEIVRLPLSLVPDCYNLKLGVSPLTVYRQGGEGDFSIVWPEHAAFTIDDTESFFHRDGDELYFSKWFEDPDYREEVWIRALQTGAKLRTIPGCMYRMPDGAWWLL